MLNCPWARGAWRISLVTVFFIASSDRKKSNTSLFSSLLYITPIRSLVRGFVARLAWFVEISSFMRAFAAFCCMSRDLCRENSNHFVSIHFHLNFDRKIHALWCISHSTDAPFPHFCCVMHLALREGKFTATQNDVFLFLFFLHSFT
jgi:hypothetical protein